MEFALDRKADRFASSLDIQPPAEPAAAVANLGAAPAVRTGVTTVDAAVPGQVLTITPTGERQTLVASPAPRRPAMGQPTVPAQALAGLGVESGGTYYPEDFGARLREAVDTGKIKPAQAAMQVAKYREWLSSPEGLMTQGAREQVAAAQDLGAIAVAEQSVAAEQQKKTAELYNQASQQIADQEAEWQGLREEYAKNQAQRMAEMDALTTEIQNTRIDPSNYWKNQGALGAALSVIGLALGAYVQGRSMGQVPNLALGELNKAIDRDIDAQKANLDIKGKALEAQRGIYGLVRQRLGDDQAAIDYTRGLMKENLANSVAEFAARSGTEKAKLAATEVVTKLRADAAKTINDVRLRLSMAERDRLARQAQARAAAAARPKLTDYSPLDAKDQERYVPQLGGLAGNAKTAETARIGIDSYDKAIEKLMKMKELRLTGNTGGFGTDAATYDALQSSVTFDMKNATEAGALDKGLVEVLKNMVPESALFSFDANAATALDQTAAILKGERQKLIDRTVVQPYELVNTPAGLFGRATSGRSVDTLTLKKVEE